MTNAAQKTPISLLQELCAQFGMTPDYKLMSVEGAVHAPTFMYRVEVNDVAVTATGQSKKKAKHAAAKAVLEKLLSPEGEYSKGFVSDGVMVNSESLNELISHEIFSEQVVVPVVDDNAANNPVGALQEKCMKQRWQPPYYETERATGLPHEKIFYIACYVDQFREIGEGKSKRLAKRQAAENMLNRLNKLNIDNEDEEGESKDACSNEDDDETPPESNTSGLENSVKPFQIKWDEVIKELNADNVDSKSNTDSALCNADENSAGTGDLEEQLEPSVKIIRISEPSLLDNVVNTKDPESVQADPLLKSDNNIDDNKEKDDLIQSCDNDTDSFKLSEIFSPAEPNLSENDEIEELLKCLHPSAYLTEEN